MSDATDMADVCAACGGARRVPDAKTMRDYPEWRSCPDCAVPTSGDADNRAMTDPLTTRLSERYADKPVPPCRVCGAHLSLSSGGGGSLPKYNCSSLGMDFGVKANKHYYASEHFHNHGDPDVIALLTERAILIAERDEGRAQFEAIQTFAHDLCILAQQKALHAELADDDNEAEILRHFEQRILAIRDIARAARAYLTKDKK